MGNWLNREQAQLLMAAPDISTITGQGDRALFVVLIGCGLRRSEAAGLTFEHIQHEWAMRRSKRRSITWE
jgi:site-specific recombinase XerD